MSAKSQKFQKIHEYISKKVGISPTVVRKYRSSISLKISEEEIVSHIIVKNEERVGAIQRTLANIKNDEELLEFIKKASESEKSFVLNCNSLEDIC